MITQRIYSHQFSSENRDSEFQTYEKLEEAIKKSFPEVKARLHQTFGKSSLLYRIPVLLGLNEVRLSAISFGKGERGLTYAYVNTEGLFGDKINRRLLKTLEALGMKEDARRAETLVPYSEILERRLNEFSVATADKQVDELVKELIEASIQHRQRDENEPINSVRLASSKSLSNIINHDQGKYIEISANSKIQNTGSVFCARYQPGTQRIVIVKN